MLRSCAIFPASCRGGCRMRKTQFSRGVTSLTFLFRVSATYASPLGVSTMSCGAFRRVAAFVPPDTESPEKWKVEDRNVL